MEKIDLNEYLASNEYPGRGIAVAKAPDGRQMFIGYFIMGRSENSRNRVFDPVPERGGICTMAADPAKLEDPSLIIYNPVLTLGKTHIVTNGDQTDTIFDEMSRGKSFADALRTRTFEPDEPNYTPRISAVVYADGSYQMSILKSADGNGDSVQRYFFDYPQPVAGEGHFISTYKHNGNPIPSFEGEPLRFACPRTIGDFAQGLWSSLNPDNKVSLFARVIDLDSGETGDMIFNKYDAVCSDLDDPEEPELLPEEEELSELLDRLELLSEEPESLLFAPFSFASASAFAFSSAAFFAASSAFRRSSSALMIAFSSSSSFASSEFCCLINALYVAASCFAFAICASKSFDWDFFSSIICCMEACSSSSSYFCVSRSLFLSSKSFFFCATSSLIRM